MTNGWWVFFACVFLAMILCPWLFHTDARSNYGRQLQNYDTAWYYCIEASLILAITIGIPLALRALAGRLFRNEKIDTGDIGIGGILIGGIPAFIFGVWLCPEGIAGKRLERKWKIARSVLTTCASISMCRK